MVVLYFDIISLIGIVFICVHFVFFSVSKKRRQTKIVLEQSIIPLPEPCRCVGLTTHGPTRCRLGWSGTRLQCITCDAFPICCTAILALSAPIRMAFSLILAFVIKWSQSIVWVTRRPAQGRGRQLELLLVLAGNHPCLGQFVFKSFSPLMPLIILSLFTANV